MCALPPFLFFSPRFGSLSSSRVRPKRSKRASARSPSRSVIPSTNSKLAYPPIDTPASPFSIFLRVLRFRKPRCATSVVDNRRRKRASRMSAPSFRRAFLAGIGNACRKRSVLIMSLIVSTIVDTVHYWGTLRVLVKSNKLVVGAGGFEPPSSWSRTTVTKILNALSGAACGIQSLISPLLVVPNLYLNASSEIGLKRWPRSEPSGAFSGRFEFWRAPGWAESKAGISRGTILVR